MPTVNEGKLAFVFPATWIAISFDRAGGFYREKVEKIDGTLAVDIVAAPPATDAYLLLLEVKDFRGAEAELRRQIRSGELPARLVWKAAHSVSAMFLGATVGQDAALNAFQSVICQPPRRIDFIFFLEQDAAPAVADPRYKAKVQSRRVLRQDVEKKLREKLGPLGIHAALADQMTLPRRTAWYAQAAPVSGP